jgi:hypothetical protein
MPERAFWLHLECGHRVKWHDPTKHGDGEIPDEARCPEAFVANHGVQHVYRVEAVDERADGSRTGSLTGDLL